MRTVGVIAWIKSGQAFRERLWRHVAHQHLQIHVTEGVTEPDGEAPTR